MTFDAGAIEARLILDRSQFQAELAAATAEGDKFDGTTFTAKADLNTDQVAAEFAKIASEWSALKQQLAHAPALDVDTGEVDAKLAATEAAFEALRAALSQEVQLKADANVAANLTKQLAGSGPIEQSVTLDPSEANAALEEIQANADALRVKLETPETLDVNDDEALSSIAATLAAWEAMKDTLGSGLSLGSVSAAPVASSGGEGVSSEVLASWAALNSETSQFHSGAGDLLILLSALGVDLGAAAINVRSFGVGLGALAASAAAGAGVALGSLGNTVRTTGGFFAGTALAGLNAFGAALGRNIPLWSTGGGIFGNWTGHVQLFGGALTSIGIPAILGAASGIHLLVDGIIEFAGTLIPATAALVAFGAYGAPTVQHIYVQMSNLWTTTQALGQAIYPITAAMQSLGNAVKPEIYTLFGEALVVINAKAGEFSVIAAQAGQVVDMFGARIAAAVTDGSGFSTFFTHAASDLQGWFNVIGNLGGIIGNVLKVLPGYAEVILSALGGVTHAIESFTGSGLGQWLLEVGLAAHGAILYIGLLGTAFAVLSRYALGAIASGLTGVANVIVRFGTTGAGAAVGLDRFATSIRGITNVQLGWIGIAAAALGFLIDKLVTAKDATQQYVSATQQALGAVPVSQAAVAIVQQQAEAISSLKVNQADLTVSQKSLTTATSQSTAAFADQNFGLTGTGNAVKATGASVDSLTQSVRSQTQAIADSKAILPVLSSDMSNYNAVLKAAGGSTAILATAGITTNQVFAATPELLKQIEILAAANVDQFNAMALGTGRAGAAMNALNYTGDTTNNMLGSLDVDMANITSAQDKLTDVLLGGEQAFYTYATNVGVASAKLGGGGTGIAGLANTAGASLSGLNAQSIALGNSFYSTLVPSSQKVVDSLEMQLITTPKLTQVVGTLAGQMLGYAGNNVAAKTSVENFINDALGPGTVSFQNLNKWVGTNATTMAGMKAIVDQTEVSASKLGGTIQSDVEQFQALATLQAHGGQAAWTAYAASVDAGTMSGQAWFNQNAQVMSQLLTETGGDIPAAKKAFMDFAINGLDLSKTAASNLWTTLKNQYLDTVGSKATETEGAFEKLAAQFGLSKTAADNLWTSLHKIASGSPYSAYLTETGKGTFTISNASAQAGAGGQQLGGPGHPAAAAGMLVTGGTPGVDSVMVLAQQGELILPTAASSDPAAVGLAKKYGVPGFAAGGTVGYGTAYGSLGGDTSQFSTNFYNQMTSSMETAMTAALKAAQAAAQAAANAAMASMAGVSNASAIAALTTAAASHGWTGIQLTDLLNVEAREAGGSLTATNPTSGAYGMAQFINGPSEYAQYGGNATTYAGQATAMANYIAQRYGNPAAAWAHELAFGWYDHGGPLYPGWTKAYNGTGRIEHIVPHDTLSTLMQAAQYGSMVGDYPGIVSPVGGFGITASQLGLPPPVSTASSSATVSTGSNVTLNPTLPGHIAPGPGGEAHGIIDRLEKLLAVASAQLSVSRQAPEVTASRIGSVITQASMPGTGLGRRYPNNR